MAFECFVHYRRKYPKVKRIKAFFDWLGFKILDWIWGNGESAWKLLRTVTALLVLIALRDVFAYRDPWQVGSYLAAAVQAPQIFLGTLLATILFGRIFVGDCLLQIGCVRIPDVDCYQTLQ